jgi:cysteine sulfinate desulfinase/cysteine desulfurase-like protein
MKVDDDYIGGAIRMSFSDYNTMDEARKAVEIIKKSVERLRKYTRP